MRGSRRWAHLGSTIATGSLLSLPMLPRSSPVGEIATQFRLQPYQIDEHVSLTAQLVGYHGDRGYYGHVDASALNCLDQRTKIAIAGKQHDLIDMLGDVHSIDR